MSAPSWTGPATEAVDSLARVRTPGWAARVEPFLAAGLLEWGDVHVVDRLAATIAGTREAPTVDLDVLLGLAFAVRAPRAGHTGVALAELPSRLGLEFPYLPWPADLDGWHAKLVASPLVATSLAAGRPFLATATLIQTARMAGYEHRLAATLRARASAGRREGRDLPRLLADLDRLFPPAHGVLPKLAAVMALLAPTCVIAGGPGTGKTTTIRRLLLLELGQARAQGRPPPRVALAAPTGKAAARMRESLLEQPRNPEAGAGREPEPEPEADPEALAWLAELEAVTLHRLLSLGSASRYRPDADNPLAHELVIVDEASMISTAIMAKLVDAVAPTAQLVLLGDPNQLASVEAGSALADLMIGLGTANVRLPPRPADEIAALLGEPAVAELRDAAAPALAGGMIQFTRAHRFESAALREPIEALARADLDAAITGLTRSESPAVRHVEHDAGALAPAILAELVDGFADAIAPLRAHPREAEARALTLEALTQLRVLTAHRAGSLGVAGLNTTLTRLIQARLELSARHRQGPWWLGRMILIQRNDYEQELWNGDIGVLAPAGGGGWEAVFATSGGVRCVAAASLPDHETAFAMTIHKSQGSQFGHTVVVLPEQVTTLLTRELIYTGISRASRRLTLCGSESVLREGLERRVVRATGLAELLWD